MTSPTVERADQLTPEQRKYFDAKRRQTEQPYSPPGPVPEPRESTVPPEADTSSVHRGQAEGNSDGLPGMHESPTAPGVPSPDNHDPNTLLARIASGEMVLSSTKNADHAAVGVVQGLLSELNAKHHFSSISLPSPGQQGYSHFGPATQQMMLDFAKWYNQQPQVSPDSRIQAIAVFDAQKMGALNFALNLTPRDERPLRKGEEVLDRNPPEALVRDRMHPKMTGEDRRNISLFCRNENETVNYLHKRGFLVNRADDGKLVVWLASDKERKAYKIDPQGWGDFGNDIADMFGPAAKAGGALVGGAIGALLSSPAGGVGAIPGALLGVGATEGWLLNWGRSVQIRDINNPSVRHAVRDNAGSWGDYAWAAGEGAVIGGVGLLSGPAAPVTVGAVATGWDKFKRTMSDMFNVTPKPRER